MFLCKNVVWPKNEFQTNPKFSVFVGISSPQNFFSCLDLLS